MVDEFRDKDVKGCCVRVTDKGVEHSRSGGAEKAVKDSMLCLLISTHTWEHQYLPLTSWKQLKSGTDRKHPYLLCRGVDT